MAEKKIGGFIIKDLRFIPKELLCFFLVLFFVFAIIFILPINAFSIERTEKLKIFDKSIREMFKKGILPIIDVEYHHSGKIEIERLIKRMDENGVALTWLGPNEKRGSEESIRVNELYPDRLVASLRHT